MHSPDVKGVKLHLPDSIPRLPFR